MTGSTHINRRRVIRVTVLFIIIGLLILYSALDVRNERRVAKEQRFNDYYKIEYGRPLILSGENW